MDIVNNIENPKYVVYAGSGAEWLVNPECNLVFHYTSSQKAVDNILHSGQIKFGNLCNTNDLYESTGWGFYEDIASGVMEEICDKWDCQRSITDILHSRSRVFCTARDSANNGPNPNKFIVNRGYAIQSLWAHYADKHKGVCFAFNEAKLKTSVSVAAKTLKARLYQGNISYGLVPSKIQEAFSTCLTDVDKNKMYDFLLNHIETYKDTILFTKDSSWFYENEYRFVAMCKSVNDSFEVDIADSLVGIILGPFFSDREVAEIYKKAKKFNIQIAELYYFRGEYCVFGK